MKKIIKNKKGFSLVELILYISILVFFLGSMFLFVTMVMESKAKNQTINEVERQGEFIARTIIKSIRKASSINSPSAGSSSSNLSLVMSNVTKNPTTFTLTNTDLFITEGVQTPIILNNNLIDITNIVFRNVTRASTTGIIRVEITIAHKNPANQNEFKYEKTFYGSATVRR
ncbi:MAG: prepilin-type N-terminal cleavage/methylation domain-containing protein [Candidatus Magasanikbacteria bacterium]|nr:prepilin-type N-terminal cleavage/methylation domain-containing protein [Candidatus Magasanikbacteria bacterium]